MIDIDGAVTNNDLLALVEKAGAQMQKVSSEWRGACPLHGGDNNNAFAVYHKDGKDRWRCFTGPCGGGDILDFVMKWQGFKDFMDAYHYLEGDISPDPQLVAQHAAEKAARVIAEMEAQITRAQNVLNELRHAQTWLTYHQQLIARPDHRELWRRRGVSDAWQDFWKLGYCPSFAVGSGDERITTPSLTIPVFGAAQGDDWPVMNVRHRLLNPPKPNDKYRPDRPGLQVAPYIANPYSGWDTDPVLVLEGEIKTMVTFSAFWQEGETIQIIGIPGKTQFRSIADHLRGHDVYICFDPDASEQAHEAAHIVGGKAITFPMKIDDAINAGALDKAGIKRLLRMGRKS